MAYIIRFKNRDMNVDKETWELIMGIVTMYNIPSILDGSGNDMIHEIENP